MKIRMAVLAALLALVGVVCLAPGAEAQTSRAGRITEGTLANRPTCPGPASAGDIYTANDQTPVVVAACSSTGWTPIGGGAGTTDVCVQATKTASYPLVVTDCIIFADASGGGFTLTLPHAVTSVRWNLIRKDTTIANTVTVQPDSGNVDNQASVPLVPGSNLIGECDGTNCWTTQIAQRVVGRNITTGTDTVVSADLAPKTLTFSNSTGTTETVPDVGSSGFPQGSLFNAIIESGAGNTTWNRTSASSFVVCNGSLCSAPATSFQMTSGQYATFQALDSTNWTVTVTGGNANAGPLTFPVTAYQSNAGTANGTADASSTNGSQTITCPNSDCGFSATNVGNIIFGIGPGAIANCPPQGTITAINNANSVQVSIAATVTATATCQLRWGPDATPGIQAAQAALAANPNCGVLVLPAGGMIWREPILQSIPAHCRTMGGAQGEVFGESVTGSAIGSGRQSVFFPTPDFDYAAIPTNGAMFGGAPIYMANFVIDGANQSLASTANVANKGILQVGNGSFAQNITITVLGQGVSGGAFYGINFAGQGGIQFNLTIDGAGTQACTVAPTVQTTFFNIYCSTGLSVSGSNGLGLTSNDQILSLSSFYLAGGTNGAGVSLASATGSTFNSFGDIYNCQANGNCSAIAFNGSTNSHVNLNGATITANGAASQLGVYFATNAGTLELLNSNITTSTSAPIGGVAGAGTVVDLSGNTCNNGPCPGTGTNAFTGAYLTSTNEVGRLSQTVTTATVGPTTAYGTGTGGAGVFRVCVNAHVTAAGTAGTVQPVITWNNGAAQTATLGTLSLTTANNEYPNGAGGASTNLSCMFVSAAASTNIQVQWTVAGATGTPSTTAVTTVEKM
jgi:hypothetical protein